MKYPAAVLVIAMAFTAAAGPLDASSEDLINQLLLASNAIDYFGLLPDKENFIFDFNDPQANLGDVGEIVVANRATFPTLAGTDSGMTVGRLGACGVNHPHIHPRGTELQVLVKGKLVTEMVPENGILDVDGSPRLIRSELGLFQMTPFYQGYVHTQFNPGCEPAIFVSYFPSEDFGILQTETNVTAQRHAIPPSIALGVEQCLEKCGLQNY